ncbi:unnamed protein product [Haemonchus placei]|uniref:Transmembrane protein n=1 Tax=Haemonchus placei TaxID=6290 RepID=A0A158QL29_HAEPC|nr:unnamed protein product [Haemonchus placei]
MVDSNLFELSNNALPIVRCLFQFYIILVVSTVYHIQCIGKKKPTKRSSAGLKDDHETVLKVESTPPPTETETSDLVTVNETPSSLAEKSQKYHSIAATPTTIDYGTIAAATESSSVWASDVMKVLDIHERKPKPATFTTTSHMVGYRSDESLIDARTQPTVRLNVIRWSI